ncbi:glycosyl hydrolase family 28-related protein [Bradyrhizobium paxllaeri]|uniref:glycosyl hydrolase family 28-related protein n=1 Tax=Bradyrhizobium paxllaeri TaxID=190148 RepID=UPI000810C006|nr:glycosyl hydrolase family 28-related protein [Bradyrhizobium paxllaeri]
MSGLRCAVLAFALIAGFGSAFAQAPPPVPALPDTERRTSYIITNSVSATADAPALYVRPHDYGAFCDGVTNDAAALQNMLNDAEGKTIFMPAGTCLTKSTLTMPSNTTITGAGREVSILKSTANPALSAANQSNISLSHFQILGTDSVTSWTSSSYGPVRIVQDGSAVAAGTNYNIQNMKFAGFNTTYWIYFSAVGSTFPLRNITFANNYILSVSADIPTDENPAKNNNFGLTIYSGNAGHGRIENTLVKDNRADSTGMCFPLVLFSNHYKFQITGNLVLNPGNTTPGHCSNAGGTASNSYGILVYDINGDNNPPSDGIVSSNTVIAPTSAGIYMVGTGSSNSIVSNNLIDGQTSQDDTTLPRGGIAINGLTDINAYGNRIVNSFGGVAAVSQSRGTIHISGNTCSTGVGAGTSTPFCVKVGAANGSSNTSKHVVKQNYLETLASSTTTIRSVSATGARFGDVDISFNTIMGGFNGLDFSSQFASGSVIISGNKFGGVASSFMMSVAGNTGSAIAITNNVFDSIAGVSGNALVAGSATIHTAGNKFINRTSGAVAMFTAVGACGTITGTQFNKVVQAAQVAATSLGTANPSGCTLNYLDRVQNLTPTEIGPRGSKYKVDHWWHASTSPGMTHLEARMLTGN